MLTAPLSVSLNASLSGEAKNLILGVINMHRLIARFVPEELIRLLQTAYWSIRLYRIYQQLE